MPNLPLVLIACKVFQDFIEHFLPNRTVKQTVFLEYGLHRVPRNLKQALQVQINNIEESNLILLDYSLTRLGSLLP